MENLKKANEIRTHLLLKTASEIERFKKLKMKINSISPQNLFKLYSNIEICMERRIFSTTQRKNSQTKFLDENSFSKNEYEYENSPILEPGIKLNKVLISSKKNEIFYEKIEKENLNQKHRFSQDTSDTSNPLNPQLLIKPDDIDKNHFSIQFLRRFAKTLIIKKRKKKHSKSFYQNRIYKSQGNLTYLERNPMKHFSAHTKTNNKLSGSSSKEIIKEIFEETVIENSPVIYSSGLFCPAEHKGIYSNTNNLNNNCCIMYNETSHVTTYINSNKNNIRSSLMNIPYEYKEVLS
jgi:hypothetical protein